LSITEKHKGFLGNKRRDDADNEPETCEWISVDKFIWRNAKLDITLTYCPGCAKKM